MSYYGRNIGRAKGVGKMVNWNQGGGPMKAGLGPQINVSTWARRVIARRTNSCCCDPIELTSVQMSLPRMTAGPSGVFNNAQKSDDTPWNQWMPGGDVETHVGGGYVGPPRNDITGGVILSTNQIYVIFTFNKPISPSYSIYKYNPSLPTGTSLELIGLKKVDQSVTNSPLGAPVKVTTINPPGVDYYIREAKLASVTQIPGGTEVLTFDETNQRLTTGSRFLIDSEIVTGVGTKAKSNLNTINAKIFPAMQSGLNHAEIFGFLPTNYFGFGPPQNKISSYGAFNRRLDYETRGGFAPEKPANPVVPGSGGTGGGPAVDFWDFEKTNHFLGNIFGVYTKTTKRASDQYDMSGSGVTTSNLNIEPNLSTLNIRLVQSNQATGVPISTRVENYSADAAYVSTGPVKWLDYQHALFINITSIMQIMLKNPTANAVPKVPGNTIPAGQGWDGTLYPTIVPTGAGPGAFGSNGAPPMPKYYAGNPLQMITATEMSAGPALTPQVIRPTSAKPQDSSVATDWRNSNFNNAGKYATFVSDASGLLATPQVVQKSGPWSIGAINGNIHNHLPSEEKLPSWTDATWNQIGYVRQMETGATEVLCYNAVTIDSGGQYGTGAPAPGFETQTFHRSGLLEATIKYSSYHILYYGHVIEKMRQLTYNGFGSYLIRDILSSKYDCGNNGFDGPIGDIIIPSGDKTITTTDNTTEAGLLTFDSDALSLPLSAATPALPPPPVPPTVPPPTVPPIDPNPDPTLPPPTLPPPTVPPSGGTGGGIGDIGGGGVIGF